MIVPDPNVVGFVRGLSPPPPLPALLPRNAGRCHGEAAAPHERWRRRQ